MTTALDGPYAVNLDLAGRAVLVVGGGRIAARKLASLLRAGAHVTVVAPDAVPEIADDPDVRWHRRPYRRGEVASYRLAITATDEPTVNRQVFADGEAANVFVNSADDPANCSFTLPSIAQQGDLTVAVSTNGRSPALASWLRRRIDTELATGYAALLDVLAEARRAARAEFGTSEVAGWTEALDQGLLDLVRQGRADDARTLLHDELGLEREARSA